MDLAIFSGKSHFRTPQHVGGPIVEPETRERFHKLADEAFARNYLTNAGPLSIKLEEEVAKRHGVADAVFMANATLAQQVLMKAMGLDSGEAIVSANTFVATPHVCEWVGMKPVFADIDPDSLDLDPADFERRITNKTRAVVPTHVFGVISDMNAIVDIARRHGIAVLADAAHAFDCDRGGVLPGGFGAPEFLSFHATKFFGTLEGGAALTNDRALAAEMREIRNFGFNRPNDAGKLGTNAKASEISAAFGLASLPALEQRREALGRIREIYVRELSGTPGLRIHPLESHGRNNFRYFAFFVEDGAGVSRDAVYEALRRENVLVRLYFHPGCHRMEYYRAQNGGVADNLPVTDDLLGRILSLPTSFFDIDPVAGATAIAGLVKTMFERADEVEAWWSRANRQQPNIVTLS